jgi:hypothetical protein
LIGTAWIWIFWPMMTGETVVGFRDSAYLYYPLFKWIDAQWAAGEIPLWNPYCNFGMPVVADGTSSVFYPGKLVFFCRFLSYPARYGIYLAVHIPIAAAGTYWFARTLRANRTGATLAAFSFAFGGSVLFQVTNVIYLVSAAWLPFALCCVWKMVKTGKPQWAVGAGACCAMMILGGDPQMVYHVGLIAVATIAGEFLRRRRRMLKSIGSNSTASRFQQTPYRWLLDSGLKLGVMIVVTCLLSAVQLLPTYFWAKHSERGQPDVPANVYMAIGSISQSESRVQTEAVHSAFGLLAPPVGTVDHAYQFSQPPWSISELIWPNVSGKPFPRNQRWTNGLPGAERVWVPSIYVGVVVLFLGLMGIRLWGRRRRQVWLTWVMLFFWLASFGWYGGVWLINEVFNSPDPTYALGPQVGGIYWAMNMLLPKYFMFRYPAKLFVIASLALSLLAGIQLRSVGPLGWRVLTVIVLALSGIGICTWIFFVDGQLASVPVDGLFGPYDKLGAESGFWFSFIQPAIAIAIIRLVSYLIQRHPSGFQSSKHLFQLAIVVVTAIDVMVANRWLVPQVDAGVFESDTLIHERLDELKASRKDAAPIIIWRSRDQYFEPEVWQSELSDNRLSEIVKWQRESLYPKHHLGENVILMGSFSSIWPKSYEVYLQYIERLVATRNENSELPFHGLIARNSSGEVELIQTVPAEKFNPPTPICWLGELESHDDRLFDDEPEFESRVTSFTANGFVASVSTNRPRTLLFSRIADAGWTASLRDLATNETQMAEVDVDRDLEMLFLSFHQPGDFEVVFRYRPKEFWVGAWISGFSWAFLVFGIAGVKLRSKTGSR